MKHAATRRALVTGLVFIGLGVMFLLEAIGWYQLAAGTLWAVLLIAVGVGVMAGAGQEGDSGDDDPFQP
jgi:hypothetical protein